jgi:tetratricopeptide (TPR) repeat protein
MYVRDLSFRCETRGLKRQEFEQCKHLLRLILMCYKVDQSMSVPENVAACDSKTDPTSALKELLSAGNALVATRGHAEVQRALSIADEALRCAEQFDNSEPQAARLLAAAWLLKGNALREAHRRDSRQGALDAYDKALELFRPVMDMQAHDDLNQLAKLWINRGMVLLDDGSREALTEALSCFESAIALRQRLPLDENKFFVWGLSAAWMNCADVLTRLGSAEQVERALHAYDEAIALLVRMPLDEHPTYRARLSLAWMNRGLAAQAQDSPESLVEAVRCYTRSIEQYLGKTPSNSEQRRVLSCAHLNRGHAFLNSEQAKCEQARQDAFSALRLAGEFERSESLAARIGLQARHLLCRAIAHQADCGEVSEDWIGETTDAVDDGMALARHWRRAGESGLEDIEAELFRFGALIYRLCQPHFLTEFLLESLDPVRSPGAPVGEQAVHHIGTEALWSATVDLRAQQQADARPDVQSRLLSRLEEYQGAEKRLTELRLQHLCAI